MPPDESPATAGLALLAVGLLLLIIIIFWF
jgi:MYXO-CTERM domain-containing protein